VVDEKTDLSRGANNNVIVTNVRRRGEKIMRIVNIYDQRDSQSGERLARKMNWQSLIRQGRTVLAGDFNGQSSRWDPRFQIQRNAAFWEEVLAENGLEVSNDGQPTHYWTSKDHEGDSVIDLTLAT